MPLFLMAEVFLKQCYFHFWQKCERSQNHITFLLPCVFNMQLATCVSHDIHVVLVLEWNKIKRKREQHVSVWGRMNWNRMFIILCLWTHLFRKENGKKQIEKKKNSLNFRFWSEAFGSLFGSYFLFLRKSDKIAKKHSRLN